MTAKRERDLEVVIAWQAGELSEAQAAALLKTDKTGAREFLRQAKRRGIGAWNRARGAAKKIDPEFLPSYMISLRRKEMDNDQSAARHAGPQDASQAEWEKALIIAFGSRSIALLPCEHCGDGSGPVDYRYLDHIAAIWRHSGGATTFVGRCPVCERMGMTTKPAWELPEWRK